MSQLELFEGVYAPDDAPSTDAVFEPEPVELPEAIRLLKAVGTDDDPYREGGKWAYADRENMRGRCFFITQALGHPGMLEPLFTEEMVERGCSRKGITKWAWMLHNRDTITQEEVDSGECPPGAQVGDPKNDHIHVVVRRNSAATIGVIARAFGVPPQQVELKSERAFYDLVEYLTHENPNQSGKGKHVYDRDEVHTNISDLWERVDEHVKKRHLKETGGGDIFLAVMRGEMTLADVRAKYPEFYSKKGNIGHLQKMRGDYLAHAEPPSRLLNVLIWGEGGTGKELLAGALAQALSPGDKPFHVGNSNVAFENYDGEQVLHWEDVRIPDLLEAFDGRGGMFMALNPYRNGNRTTVKVKHSHTSLVNSVNIFTTSSDSASFLLGMAGEYTDRAGTQHKAENAAQAFRRVPLIVHVEAGTYSVHVNKGVLYHTREFEDYEVISGIRQNLEQALCRAENIDDEEQRAAAIRDIQLRAVAPIMEQIERLRRTSETTDPITVDEFLAEFSDIGTIDPRQEVLDAAATWHAQGLQIYTAYFGKSRNEHPHWRELNAARGNKTVTLTVIEDTFGSLDDAQNRENALSFYDSTEAITPPLSPEHSAHITSIFPDARGWD